MDFSLHDPGRAKMSVAGGMVAFKRAGSDFAAYERKLVRFNRLDVIEATRANLRRPARPNFGRKAAVHAAIASSRAPTPKIAITRFKL